jgi:hypothetical protein
VHPGFVLRLALGLLKNNASVMFDFDWPEYVTVTKACTFGQRAGPQVSHFARAAGVLIGPWLHCPHDRVEPANHQIFA